MNEPSVVTMETVMAHIRRLKATMPDPPQLLIGRPGSFAGMEEVPGHIRFLETDLAPIGEFRAIPDFNYSRQSFPRFGQTDLFLSDPSAEPPPISFRMQFDLPILRPPAFTRICVSDFGSPTVGEMRASRAFWRGKKRLATTQARKQRKARRRYVRHVVATTFRSLKENHGPLSGKV